MPPVLWEMTGLPFYSLLYLAFGMHFLFPKKLRKYHGAEHKVFSSKGLITRVRLRKIQQASIVNRGCSTNVIVVYFSSVLLGSILLVLARLDVATALAISSYGAIVPACFTERLNKHWLKRYILPVSAFLQRYVTTSEPERMHLLAAITSYGLLAEKEFPHRIRRIKKERKKKMAIVDVTIIPIGTEGPSVSDYVASIQTVLESYGDNITYQLTPMSTLIEGELPVLFEVIQAIHEVPFKSGIKRVATNIRIDDRRDKHQTMESKLASVQEKMVQ
ncbi:MTH1187 family thiamine-binding protein [Shouchella plakortidis]|uniref:MTH1187 family thiamine-binding protein n=2 Tax=Alkalicoccobacillus plakortidis TaxID=444060 RepID=A0ABT0XPE1_9BACI|nr:MTH1187 family thiamine-binding protein [Alkalicoccobacillus plakortidis]